MAATISLNGKNDGENGTRCHLLRSCGHKLELPKKNRKSWLLRCIRVLDKSHRVGGGGATKSSDQLPDRLAHRTLATWSGFESVH